MIWTLGHPPEYGWYICVTDLSNNPKYPDYHSIQLWYNGQQQDKFCSGGGYTESKEVPWTREVIAWAPLPKFSLEMYPEAKLE